MRERCVKYIITVAGAEYSQRKDPTIIDIWPFFALHDWAG